MSRWADRAIKLVLLAAVLAVAIPLAISLWRQAIGG